MARYIAFAVLAVLVNLAIQRVVISALGDGAMGFVSALVLGTLGGLVVKYALDKRWIFADATTGFRGTSRQFALYCAMGLVTTAIFWGTETAAHLIWGTQGAREAGAVLGLTIGYLTKYQLDRRFVFRGCAP